MKLIYSITAILAISSTQPCRAEDASVLGAQLLTYCQACHALGRHRFIYSKDPAEVWTFIETTPSPGSNRLWRDEIRDALSWPDSSPPPPGSLREPGKEWMPKGSKRLEIYTDQIDDVSAREFLLRHL